MDGLRRWLAGRVGLPLVVLLVLLWSGNGARPGLNGAPPGPPAVRATLALRDLLLGHHVPMVQPAARHGQRGPRGPMAAAVLAATLAAAAVVAIRREPVLRWRRREGRLLALRPRAPPMPAV